MKLAFFWLRLCVFGVLLWSLSAAAHDERSVVGRPAPDANSLPLQIDADAMDEAIRQTLSEVHLADSGGRQSIFLPQRRLVKLAQVPSQTENSVFTVNSGGRSNIPVVDNIYFSDLVGSGTINTTMTVELSTTITDMWNVSFPPLQIAAQGDDGQAGSATLNAYGDIISFRALIRPFSSSGLDRFGCDTLKLCDSLNILGGHQGDILFRTVHGVSIAPFLSTYAPLLNTDPLGFLDVSSNISQVITLSGPSYDQGGNTAVTNSVVSPFSGIRIGGVPLPKDNLSLFYVDANGVAQSATTANISGTQELRYNISFNSGSETQQSQIWDFIQAAHTRFMGSNLPVVAPLATGVTDGTEDFLVLEVEAPLVTNDSRCRIDPCRIRTPKGGPSTTHDILYNIQSLPVPTGSITFQLRGTLAKFLSMVNVGDPSKEGEVPNVIPQDFVPVYAVTRLGNTPFSSRSNDYIRSAFNTDPLTHHNLQPIHQPTNFGHPAHITTERSVLVPISDLPSFSNGKNLVYTFYSSRDGSLAFNSIFTQEASGGIQYAADLSPCLPDDSLTGSGALRTYQSVSVNRGYNTLNFYNLPPGEYNNCMIQLLPQPGGATEGFSLHIAPFTVLSYRRNIAADTSLSNAAEDAAFETELYTNPFFISDAPASDLLQRTSLSSVASSPEAILSSFNPRIDTVGSLIDGDPGEIEYVGQRNGELILAVDTADLDTHGLLFQRTTISAVIPIHGELSGETAPSSPRSQLGLAYIQIPLTDTPTGSAIFSRDLSAILGLDIHQAYQEIITDATGVPDSDPPPTVDLQGNVRTEVVSSGQRRTITLSGSITTGGSDPTVVADISWSESVIRDLSSFNATYERAYLGGVIRFTGIFFENVSTITTTNPYDSKTADVGIISPVYAMDNVTEGPEVEVLTPITLELTDDSSAFVVKNHAQGQEITIAYTYVSSGTQCPVSTSTFAATYPNAATLSSVNISGDRLRRIDLDGIVPVPAGEEVCYLVEYTRNGDVYAGDLLSRSSITNISVNINPLPINGTVTADGGINCGSNGSDCLAMYPAGSTVRLTATPDSGYGLAEWTGDCTGGGTSSQFFLRVPSTPATCGANFVQVSTLDITPPLHGLVTNGLTGDERINCGNSDGAGDTCTGTFNAGTIVQLLATADNGYTFFNWDGDAECNGSMANPLSLTIPAASASISCTANFYANLVYVSSPTGSATFTASPPGVACGAGTSFCSAYATGTDVTLLATPVVGFAFSDWSGNAECDGSIANPLSLTINLPVSCVANFFIPTAPVSLTLASSPTDGGTVAVTSPSTGIIASTTRTVEYPSGTEVALVAAPVASHGFIGWSGTNDCNGSTNNPLQFTLSMDTTCIANFSQRQANLTVVSVPTAGGTVTVDPSGTSCGDGCTTHAEGTDVRLTPVPENGFIFSSWSGGDGCSGSDNPLRFTLSTDTTCTANFDFSTPTASLRLRINVLLGGPLISN